MSKLKKPKIALFHFFLKKDGKGGAEKMFLDIKEHFGMDFWTGGIDLGGWGQDLVKTDIFASRLWNSKGKVFYLHKESKIPIWRLIKRQLNFLFSSKIKQLRKYDIVIFNFTGIFFVPQRLAKQTKI